MNWLQLISATASIAFVIVGAAWYLGLRIGAIGAAVTEIKDNHLHDLKDRLLSIEEHLRAKK